MKDSNSNRREEDGIIYLSVMSDGTTGPQWIDRLDGKGFGLAEIAKSVLRMPDFRPTSGVTVEIAILKGMIFDDSARIMKMIRAEADKRKLTKPNAEVACLIRENLTDEEIKEMGLSCVVAMHEPINASCDDPRLLSIGYAGGYGWLGACCGKPAYKCNLETGFAFVIPQE